MMEIRTATPADMPQMIELLRQSLGEGTVPKSAAYFNWKHYQNPFGNSLVLLAIEEGRIVGLRAFMRWCWVSKGNQLEAVRAVDTATHPDYQGKGIFKQLTLQAAEICKQDGVALVYNTPNTQSMPGYLKMGWHKTGKMPLYVGPGSLVPRLFSEKAVDKIVAAYDAGMAFSKLSDNWQLSESQQVLHTPVNKDYLLWRYQNCPIVKYGAIVEPGQFGLVFRIKKLNRLVELRICELWTEQKGMHKKARQAYRKLLRMVRPVMVSCAESPLFDSPKKRPLGLLGPFKKGPETTIKPLAKDKLNNFEGFVQWQPSVGTMELF